MLSYTLVCIVGGFTDQKRMTFILSILMGLTMLLVVIGGGVYVIHDIAGGNYTLSSRDSNEIRPTIIPKMCKYGVLR